MSKIISTYSAMTLQAASGSISWADLIASGSSPISGVFGVTTSNASLDGGADGEIVDCTFLPIANFGVAFSTSTGYQQADGTVSANPIHLVDPNSFVRDSGVQLFGDTFVTKALFSAGTITGSSTVGNYGLVKSGSKVYLVYYAKDCAENAASLLLRACATDRLYYVLATYLTL